MVSGTQDRTRGNRHKPQMQEIPFKEKKTLTLRVMEQAAQRYCGTSIHGGIHNPIRCVPEHALSRGCGPDNLQMCLPASSARSVYPPVEVGAERVVHKL